MLIPGAGLNPPMTRTNPLKALAKSIVGIALVLLMGLAVIPMGSAATPSNAPTGPSWAYGGSSAFNESGTFTTGNGTTIAFAIHAYFAWAVVYNQTNTSATTYEIQGERAASQHIYIEFCYPTCAAPRQSVNMTAIGWEKDAATANFTETGTVYVNGTATPAIALLNEQIATAENVTTSRTSSSNPNSDGYASVALSTNGALSFQPALGLYPAAPVTGEVWNSTSNYAGDVAWTGSYHVHTPMMGTQSGSLNNNLTKSGVVELFGADHGNQTLRNGQVVRAVAIHLLAPFRFADGWFLLPGGADMFSGQEFPWMMAFGPMVGSMDTGNVDVARGTGHFGMVAATTAVTPEGTPPSAMGPSGPMAASSVPAQTSYSPGTVQGQPMSVASAETLIGSILSAPTAGHTSSTWGGLGRLVLLVGVVAVAIGVVAYVGVSQRTPRRPAESTGNPYRQAVTPMGGQVPPRPPAPQPGTPQEKDPLGYLM